MRPNVAAVAGLCLTIATFAGVRARADAGADLKLFHAAVAAGKIKDVQGLLEDHPDFLSAVCPGESDRDRITPIHTAVANGRLDIVKLFLDKGVSVQEISYGTTPLTRATYSARDEIIELLLDRGADINDGVATDDLQHVTPIRAAQIHGHLATAQLLLEKGARIDIYAAAGLGWKHFVRDQLKRNPDLAKAADGWGSTPITNAICAGQAETTKLLIDAGADFRGVHQEMKFGGLHLCAERNYPDLAKVLLDAGLDPNVRDYHNSTPLSWALRCKNEKVVALLKAHGGTE